MTSRTVVHLSPHPDDEAIGAPATLLGLRGAGWHVVNVLLSLGRAEERRRRRVEAEEAARRADFELALPPDPFAISSGDDHQRARQQIAEHLRELIEARRPDLVIAPDRADAHHGHRTVGEAAHDVMTELAVAVPWWTWSVWSDLPTPTLYSPFDEHRLDEVLHVLAAYDGELGRNPYDRFVRGRALAAPILGSERLFGFGSPAASPLPYAELLTELTLADGVAVPAPARILDVQQATSV